MKQFILHILTILFILIIAAPAFAVVPPSDEEAERLRNSPDLEEKIEFCNEVLEPLLYPSANPEGVMNTFGNGIARNFGKTTADEDFIERYDKNSDTIIDERDFIEMAFEGDLLRREGNSSPTQGDSNCIVLLIKFPDATFETEHGAAYWDNMFFGDQFLSTNSYYDQVSDGALNVTGDVLTNPSETDGFWLADHEKDYYPTQDLDVLLGEILDKADVHYDFSQYDADGNAEADGVFFIYAGMHGEWASFYWGWATYGNWWLDGVKVGPLQFCGEYLQTYRVAAHELGHMMGLPDLYDYNFIDEVAWGIGNWGLMGKGEVYMTPWSRMKLGWEDVITVSMDQYDVEIYPQVTNPPIYRLWTEGAGGNEYFLLSYVKQDSYDVNMPGEGLVIWHCDETGNNNNWWHKKVDVEEADGLDDLDNFNNSGDATDPYYDPNNSTFDHDSYPNSDNYDEEATNVAVLNISTKGGDFMTADLIVGVPGNLEVDETEPNDVREDVGVIDVVPPNGIYDGRVDYTVDPSDFWTYNALNPGLIKVDVVSHNPNANLSLFVWDATGLEPLASAESTNAGEHLECILPVSGEYFIEVRAANKAGYYDILTDFDLLPDAEKIQISGTDLMPTEVYGDCLTIPVLRLSALNGGGCAPQLNELRVHATGSAHYSLLNASLWLDDGDLTFGPGNDQLIAGPVPFDTQSGTAVLSSMALDLDVDTELFITVDLGEVWFDGGTVGVRMFAYKDFEVSEGLVEYHNFPLSSTQAMVFNPPTPLCYVAAGDFVMGSDPLNDPYYNVAGDLSEETPVHMNRTGDYYISRYEITNAQYAEFMSDGGYDTEAYWSSSGWNWKNNNNVTKPNEWNGGDYPIGVDYPEYPVGGVSQYEAHAFANWFGGRLPHEAEWEKAGRGTDARLFTWGNTFDSSNFRGYSPSVPIGSYPQSDSIYGVSDLHGNVFEWLEDGWQWGLYDQYALGDLTPPSGGTYAMQRGYGWLLVGEGGVQHAARLPYRDTWPRRYRWTFLGFRVVFDPPY